MSDAIAITNLHKSFGQKKALNGVSLTVAEKQIFGFLGPNGAGKTTTIRCLMDYIRPDQGQVAVFSHDARFQSTAVKQHLGYMSADNHMYDSWTVQQHLDFARSVWGKLPKAKELCRRLELDTKAKAKHLSTGNHQKLGLVLAIAHNPRLLVLDEPTRGLDPLLQQEFQNILNEYRQDGGTVFISSHNLAEVEQLCDEVGIIKDGQMVANKSMADIRAMKVHLITALFRQPVKRDQYIFPGLEVVSHDDKRLIAKLPGDISPLLQHFAKLPLADLEISHVPLEEVFLSYYRQEKKSSSPG